MHKERTILIQPDQLTWQKLVTRTFQGMTKWPAKIIKRMIGRRGGTQPLEVWVEEQVNVTVEVLWEGTPN